MEVVDTDVIISQTQKMVDGQDDNNKLVVQEPQSDAEPTQAGSVPAPPVGAGPSGTVGSLAKLVGDEAHRKKEALELSMGFVQCLRTQQHKQALQLAYKLIVVEPENKMILEHLPMLEEIVSDEEDDDDDDEDDDEEEEGEGDKPEPAAPNPNEGGAAEENK